MVLSNDLISKFVKITRDDKKTNNETTVYGTIVESNGAKYVRFDGADENQLTPAIMTVDAENGERVSVLIKDHTATVTGNISSPAARIETVNIVTDTVEAQNGKISKIEADNVVINESFTAHSARMDEIDADNVKINNQLIAVSADIEELETNKLSAAQADVKYANIDFANIGEAAIKKLFGDSGIIGDLVMSDGHVTGKLVGVTIIGDLIEGGTVKAEKLVIRGTDGLFYKLNTNGATVSSEQTDYNSLNGTIITAKSVTAEKINVDDLVAFGATIGGFHITEDSIYSGAKASVDNTTRGIYQDTDGQFAIGDASNFLKFYKDTDGTYKLTISASTIIFGDSGKSVEEAITEIQNGVDNLEIGGRNLLYQTGMMSSWDTTDIDGIGESAIVDGVLSIKVNENIGTGWSSIITTSRPLIPMDELIGKQLIISFDVKANEQKSEHAIYMVPTSFYSETGNKGAHRDIVRNINVTTEWQRVSYEFPAVISDGFFTNAPALGVGDLFGFRIYNKMPGTTLYLRKIKLEAGNRATDWTPAPEDVEAEIDSASKTAKNFMEFDATNGLQIGNKTGGSWRGFRSQITSTAFNILNAAGTVLASYGEKLIELGKNATDAIIKLCGGKGQIEYVTDEDSGTDYIQMSSDRVRIKSSKMSSVYSMYTDNSTRWEKSAVNVSPTKVELYASECVEPTLSEHLEGWHITRVDIESGKVDVETPGPVTFNSDGVYDNYGKLMSVERGSSGIWKYSKWSDGTVDLWGVYSVSNLACTTALGGWYRTAVFTPSAFPFTVTNPRLVANYESDGYGAMLWATTTTTTTKPPSYYLIRPTSATIASGKIIFHVTGTWV